MVAEEELTADKMVEDMSDSIFFTNPDANPYAGEEKKE